MSTARQILALLCLTSVAAVATGLLHPHPPAMFQQQEPLAADEVTMPVIAQKWKNDVLLIDARPRDQFEKEHVPGAIPLNEQDFTRQMIDFMTAHQDNTKPVIVYCDSSACRASRKIRDELAGKIPTMEFYILRGGWGAWLQAQGR